jgi:lysophospholipase L1-like esterase
MKWKIGNEPRILVFWDSIVEGDGSTDGKGWVGILREKYWSGWIWITNLGISWDTSFDLLKRIGINYPYKPDRIIIAIGINDSCIPTKIDDKPMVSLEDFGVNLWEIFHKCGQNGSEIRIIGLTNVDEIRTNPFPWSTTRKSYTNQSIKQYDSQLHKIAQDYGLRFISTFWLLTSDDLIDGLHPNDVGYRKMADFLEDFIVWD